MCAFERVHERREERQREREREREREEIMGERGEGEHPITLLICNEILQYH